MFNITDDLRIRGLRPLISPALLMEEFALSPEATNVVVNARHAATRIVQGSDDRLLVIVGPCSIHDPIAAIDYAEKLKAIADKYSNELLIIMRVYFEKPRTTLGWKGLINDPDLNGNFNINKGLRTARKLLYDLANIGMPAGTEFLDTIVPQYISDLISWGAIGARTTESQVHRELSSGLSMPIGFKNGTRGNIQIAIDAIGAAKGAHHFLSVTKHGIAAIVSTTGNDAGHIILRGASDGPNYDTDSIQATKTSLEKAGLTPKVMVDCSHGNSNKDHSRQPLVIDDLCEQMQQGETGICGVMIESNLVEGRQNYVPDQPAQYGQSITDACVSWEQTVPMLEKLAKAVKARRNG